MQQVSPQQLREWLAAQKDVLLVDVREAWEREAYNIGGLHVPMGELAARAAELPHDKTVVLYCEKGIRSVIAMQRLEMMGFNNLINLAGGMKAWKDSL